LILNQVDEKGRGRGEKTTLGEDIIVKMMETQRRVKERKVTVHTFVFF
jgi:hypothetical protein